MGGDGIVELKPFLNGLVLFLQSELAHMTVLLLCLLLA